MKILLHFILLIILLGACTSKTKVVTDSSQEGIPVVHSNQTYQVNVQEDIVYAEGLSHVSVNSAEASTMPLKLDVYTPDNDLTNRPVFIFIHGGGFRGGSKQQGRIIEWANYYSSKGWVFVSVDYRLMKHKGTIPQFWLERAKNVPQNRAPQFMAIYPAHRDAKAALRWVVANAETYQINTDYITVGGGSAGAITAISLGISNPEDFRDEINIEQDPTLSTTNVEQAYQIQTIVDLWGSKVALDALEQIYGHQRFDRNDPSLFIAHGTEDPTVRFSNAEDLKAIYYANDRPLAYYPLEGKRHGAWSATVNNKHLEELAFDFIVEQQGLIVE